MVGRTNAACGAKISAIIEQYKVNAGANISAGDFVNFVRVQGTRVSVGSTDTTKYLFTSCLLDENRVFFAFKQTGSNLYGTVITVNGDTLSWGPFTLLNTFSYNSYIVVKLMSADKVVIAVADGSYMTLYAQVVTISGTTITAGTTVHLSTVDYTGRVASIEILDDSRAVIFHTYGTNRESTYGIVLSINGTTISPGVDTAIYIGSAAYKGYVCSSLTREDGKILLLHHGVSWSGHVAVITVEGMDITVVSDTNYGVIKTSDNGYWIKLNEDRALILARLSDSAPLHGIVADITDPDLILFSAPVQLSTEFGPTSIKEPSFVSQNLVEIVYKNDMWDVYVCGDSCCAGNKIVLYDSTDGNSAIGVLQHNKLVTVYCYSTAYYAKACVVETTAILSNGLARGLAKTGGSEGDTIDIYIPNK